MGSHHRIRGQHLALPRNKNRPRLQEQVRDRAYQSALVTSSGRSFDAGNWPFDRL